MVFDPDVVKFRVKETAVLKKFDARWSEEEIESGEAEAAGGLLEEITVEDGQVTKVWKRD
jgi:hypothetical protein